MPLRPPEAITFPADLFSALGQHPADHRWWVVQTRPRGEKACARLLRTAGAAYFLPQYTRSWRKGGRNFQSHLPLFPGYLFVYGDRRAREAALGTRLVVREVPVGDHPQLARELVCVHAVLTGGPPP